MQAPMLDTSMNPLEAIVLGAVQGLTEFLPISSTAHLHVVPALLGWHDPGTAYSAFIQLGSILAVIAYFGRDLAGILTGSLTAIKAKDYDAQDLRIAGAIIFGTLPICIIGLIFKSYIENLAGPIMFMMIGGASIFMGLFLVAAEKFGSHRRGIESVGGRDGLLVGLGQAMALIPGCSRSGSTLTVAMLLGLKRDDAARFSFLLGIPAITLSGLLELKELVKNGLSSSSLADMAIGFIVSAVVSYIAIAWLMKFLRSHSTWVFVVYRLVFGALVLALTSMSIIH